MRPFKQLIAVWFVLQIVLPFTAPLQSCDLCDLLGARHHHSHPVSPESSTTPTMSQTEINVSSVAAPVEASTWSAVAGPGAGGGPASSRRLLTARDLSPSLEVQRTVLRL
jgi:hypothetical protein